jgi:hypothetical protein
MSKRDIGKEILAGLDEIAAWKLGELKLKTTRVALPKATDRRRSGRDSGFRRRRSPAAWA